MTFLHGIGLTEVVTTTGVIATTGTATIGLVATAPDADAAVFPLNTPVRITPAALLSTIAKAGTTGTLRDALRGIADIVRTTVIVVRVEEGEDADETDLNVIGTDTGGVKTGMQALRNAHALYGVRPRILVAPGLDTEDVATGLSVLTEKLRAFAYVRAQGAADAWAAYAAKFDDCRAMMVIAPDVLVLAGTATDETVRHVTATAAGMRARIDQQYGWNKTLSNVPIPGVRGITEPIEFDYQSPDAQANALNEGRVTTIVSINGEYRFWGNRTTIDPAHESWGKFTFESYTRTAHILADTIAEAMVWGIDKRLLPSLARDIVERINEKFRALVRGGFLLGATAWFDAESNSTESLSDGKLWVRYKYTPVPPLENLNLIQEFTDEYFADFAELAA